MKYLVETIGRKGVLVMAVFATVSTVYVLKGTSQQFLDFSLYVVGVFAGANVFEHFAKRVK